MAGIPRNNPNVYVLKYPQYYQLDANGNLFCKICFKVVNSSRKYVVERHLTTKWHLEKERKTESKLDKEQTFLTQRKNNVIDALVRAFVASEIPLYKCRIEHLNNLFKLINYNLPSKPQCEDI